MPIIDAHVHLYPPEVNLDPVAWAKAKGEEHWVKLCTRKRQNGNAVQDFPSVTGLLQAMDAAGVERSVLLGWYWENHATCAEQNRFYADCIRAHPDRLSAFATVHPTAGEAALEEVRWAAGEGFRGLGELSPHSQRVALADKTWRALMVLAGELRLPVNLHVTDARTKPFPGRVETPEADFIGLAREFPGTVFILAHWGGGLAFDAENRPLRNLYYDTAASPLLYSPDVWRRAIAAIGAERILFGTDFPLNLYPKTEPRAEFGRLASEARLGGAGEAVLRRNAQRLLGLE